MRMSRVFRATGSATLAAPGVVVNANSRAQARGGRRGWAALIVPSLLLCACSGSPADIQSGVQDSHLEYALDLAEASDVATSEQVEVIRQAAVAGSLSFDDFKTAIGTTLGCLADAGIVTDGPYPDDSWGFPRLTYAAMVGEIHQVTVEGPESSPVPSQAQDSPVDLVTPGAPSQEESATSRIANACREANSEFIELAYSEQPSSLTAQDAYLEQRRPEVVACALDGGYEVDTMLPTRQLLLQLTTQGEEAMQCFRNAGITSF